MASDKSSEAGCALVVIYAAAVVPLTAILQGWVLSKLWAWFIVSTFSLPQLGIGTAIGLSLVVRYLTYQHPHGDKDAGPFEAIIEAALFAIVFSLLTLGMGWITHLLIK